MRFLRWRLVAWWLVAWWRVIRRRRIFVLRAVGLDFHEDFVGLPKVIAWNREVEADGRTASGVLVEAFGHFRSIAQEPRAGCKLRREASAELQITNACWHGPADASGRMIASRANDVDSRKIPDERHGARVEATKLLWICCEEWTISCTYTNNRV